jgi:CheY-like chemotaxis protein
VAKILVADDNSNIQKMVGLALKDQGIDVVAVGNGEAAVRKISDVRPDLILADVFMPVRNGYEVCNYVKQDSALSHIPVILLVGAFDPLDEQEAQRVGADGVLKKPFVPPDPLISMVKSALTRAGVVLGAPESASPPQATSFAKPEPSPSLRVAPPPAPPASEPEPDLILPSSSSLPAPLVIDKGSEPLAFGNLLETSAPEEEAAFTAPSSAAVAADRDWGKNEAQEEEQVEEEETKTDSWRLGSLDETPNEAPAGQKDWRETAFAGIETEKSYKEWAPSVEKNSLSITEEEAAELAKKQGPLEAPPSSSGAQDWSKAIDSIFPEKLPLPQEPYNPYAPARSADPGTTPVVEQEPAPEPAVSEPAPVATASAESPAPEPAPALNSWMAGAVSPWEAELQRANELAATWDSAKVAPGAVLDDTSVTEAFLDSGLMAAAPEHAVETIEEVKVEEPPYSPEPVPNASAAVESLYSPPEHAPEHEMPAPSVSPEAPVLTPGAVDKDEPAAPESPSISNQTEELVAKVLAKMNPEVLQAVTREILKPVVEALVKDELNKK